MKENGEVVWKRSGKGGAEKGGGGDKCPFRSPFRTTVKTLAEGDPPGHRIPRWTDDLDDKDFIAGSHRLFIALSAIFDP